MRTRVGVIVVAIAAAWFGCDDRSIELASRFEQATTSSNTSSSGGVGSIGSGGTELGSGGSLAGSSGAPGNMGTNSSGPCPGWGCDGSGGNGRGGVGGTGPDGRAGAPWFGEGGAGHCPEDDPCCDASHPEHAKCIACWQASAICDRPTPDCQDNPTWDKEWHRRCQMLPQWGCGADQPCHEEGMACYEPISTCLWRCIGESCPTGYCDTRADVCVWCLRNDQCTSPFAPYCLAGNCVECVRADDCGSRRHCIAGRCVHCVTNDECAEEGLKYCSHEFNRCIECRTGADCDSGARCTQYGTCVPY